MAIVIKGQPRQCDADFFKSGRMIVSAGRKNAKIAFQIAGHQPQHRYRLDVSGADFCRGFGQRNGVSGVGVKGFLQLRAQQRLAGNKPNSAQLVAGVIRYSQLREAYVAILRTVIRVNRLLELDDAQLQEPKIAADQGSFS